MQNFQTFTPEEAEAILRRAAGTTDEQNLTESQLVAMAAELGISPSAVQAAASEHREQQESAQLIASYRNDLRGKIRTDFSTWFVTSLILAFIDFMTSHNITWSLWPIGIWGIGLFGETVDRLNRIKNVDMARVHKWRQRRLEKEQKRSQKELDSDNESD